LTPFGAALSRGRGSEHLPLEWSASRPPSMPTSPQRRAAEQPSKPSEESMVRGKTFLARWLQERARASGFATSEVQISESDTPLHRWETVYRRLTERLATADTQVGALRPTIDSWFYTLEEDVLAEGRVDPNQSEALAAATESLMERRLSAISGTAPAFSAILRTYRRALLAEDPALAEGLIAWLGGQPNVASSVKRAAAIKGDLDAFGAMHFLAGLLTILRDAEGPVSSWCSTRPKRSSECAAIPAKRASTPYASCSTSSTLAVIRDSSYSLRERIPFSKVPKGSKDFLRSHRGFIRILPLTRASTIPVRYKFVCQGSIWMRLRQSEPRSETCTPTRRWTRPDSELWSTTTTLRTLRAAWPDASVVALVLRRGYSFANSWPTYSIASTNSPISIPIATTRRRSTIAR
jgi:hypothetical protein